MSNFWQTLPQPFFVLAPMAEVTDVVFREFIKRHGTPDVFFTEFVACKGLVSLEGRKNLIRDLWYTENQRPIVGQVVGSDAEDFRICAQLLRELRFDGIDINMGCPDKKVEKQGAGASLIHDPKRSQDIIQATKEGAGDIPVSVKTRIGYNTIETESWIASLCEAHPDAITLHARTRKEMSKAPAQWKEIAKAKKIAQPQGVLLVGNGDVRDRTDGEKRISETQADGVMIGRGVYGNPWAFLGEVESGTQIADHESEKYVERMKVLAELIVLFDGFWGERKHFDILKRFFKSYVFGFPSAKDTRVRLMETKKAQEALEVLAHTIRKEDAQWSIPLYRPLELAKVFKEPL